MFAWIKAGRQKTGCSVPVVFRVAQVSEKASPITHQCAFSSITSARPFINAAYASI